MYVYSRTGIFGFRDFKLVPIQATNVAIDLGMLYEDRYVFNNYVLQSSYGCSLTDFGPVTEYDIGEIPPNVEVSPHPREYFNPTLGLPMTMRLGFVLDIDRKQYWYNRPIFSISIMGQLSKEMGRTDENDNPYGPFHALIASWGPYEASTGEQVHLIDQIERHGGLELSIVDLIKARVGYINRASILRESDYFSYGFGLDGYYLSLDYANVSREERVYKRETGSFELVNQYRNIWQLTVRVPIPLENNDNRNFWPDIMDVIGNTFKNK